MAFVLECYGKYLDCRLAIMSRLLRSQLEVCEASESDVLAKVGGHTHAHTHTRPQVDMRVAYADASPSQARAACALVLQTVEAEHRLFYQLFGVASRQLPDDERKSAASMSGNAGTKPSSRVRGPQEYMLDGDQAGLTCVGAYVRVFS